MEKCEDDDAIRQACSLPEVDLSQEPQVKEGNRVLKLMEEQLIVQVELRDVLSKNNDRQYYKMIEKIQRLGIQSRDSDVLLMRVREIERKASDW